VLSRSQECNLSRIPQVQPEGRAEWLSLPHYYAKTLFRIIGLIFNISPLAYQHPPTSPSKKKALPIEPLKQTCLKASKTSHTVSAILSTAGNPIDTNTTLQKWRSQRSSGGSDNSIPAAAVQNDISHHGTRNGLRTKMTMRLRMCSTKGLGRRCRRKSSTP